MQLRFVARQLSMLLGGLVLAMTPCMALAIIEPGAQVGARWAAAWAFGVAMVAGAALAWALRSWSRRTPPAASDEPAAPEVTIDAMGRREALLLVALTWLVGAALSATPFWLWSELGGAPDAHPFHDPASCYFEAVSGLTTTGATVLTGIQDNPKALLLWRGLLHWLGGLGIVVLFVAVLPTLGMGGKRLFQAETAGAGSQGVRPRVADTARSLWLIYGCFTAVLFALLWLLGMKPFDALVHTMSCVATGGFANHDASMGLYPSAAIQWVLILFMVLCGVNFGLYHRLVRKRGWGEVLTDPELRLYLTLLAVSSLVVWLSLLGGSIKSTTGGEVDANGFETLRAGVFAVSSAMTTTGFATADYEPWPPVAQVVLFMMLFVGGMAGSTAGGLKVVRLLVAAKVLWAEVERAFRPRVVRAVRLGAGAIDEDRQRSVVAFFLLACVIYAAGVGALVLLESGRGIDGVTAASAPAACLFNVGPAFGAVGPTDSYAHFTGGSKVLLSLLMVLGRLELFALLSLLHPRFWRQD
ncbi:MAG: TrkH family potassium uptake protein [Planctomycetota bacterium]